MLKQWLMFFASLAMVGAVIYGIYKVDNIDRYVIEMNNHSGRFHIVHVKAMGRYVVSGDDLTLEEAIQRRYELESKWFPVKFDEPREGGAR